MSVAGHRSPGSGGLEDGLRPGKRIAIARVRRFGGPPPDAQPAPSEAPEAVGSRKTVAEVTLTGISLIDEVLSQKRALQLLCQELSKQTLNLSGWRPIGQAGMPNEISGNQPAFGG